MRRFARPWVLRVVACGLLLPLSLCGWLLGGVPKLASQVENAPRPVTAENAPRGLRIFAEPGDVLLENRDVSAVVRRRDGALVDFMPRRTLLPTTDQLGTTAHIDGVWELLPVAVLRGGTALSPQVSAVRMEAAAVVVTSVLVGKGQRIGMRLRYELAATRPLLQIEVTFHGHAELLQSTDLGLSVRFGNVAYFVAGDPRPLLSHDGSVAWAGRRGAGGDLLLRAAGPPTFRAHFKSRPGFQAPLQAFLERPVSTPERPFVGRELSAKYELSYEPLPLPPVAEPERGLLEIQVRDERGRALAAKAAILPEDDLQRPVFPSDGGLDGADRFAWTGNGLLRSEPPAGRYVVLVSAGPERSLLRRPVLIAKGRPVRFEARLARVVPTPGWIAADLHLHQAASVDADVSFEARVVAVAAEGVEFAVATDHYVVTDLAPTVQQLVSSGVLSQPLLAVAGCEVSTLWTRFGHFNVFPLAAGANVEYRDTTPKRLFAAARRLSPEGVLQVNHPRWDARLGYFTHYDLDPVTGKPRKAGFDPNFDAVEVYNGDDVGDLARVQRVLDDYIHLLSSGRRYVATGSSDSHKLAFLDPGVPRTWIAHGGAADDEADPRVPVADVLRGLKAGRAVVSSGPFLEARVGNAGPGETAYAVGSRSELKLRVLAPPWVSTSRVRVLQGSTGEVVHDLPIPKSQAPLRFEQSLPLQHEKETFVIVTVVGDDPLPNSSRSDILPFGFTNPIWIVP